MSWVTVNVLQVLPIIHDVIVSLAKRCPQIIKMPETNDEMKELHKQFFGIAKFPFVIGALDCTHI